MDKSTAASRPISSAGIEDALALLDQALAILDARHLAVAAAKVEDARNTIRQSTWRFASPSQPDLTAHRFVSGRFRRKHSHRFGG